MRFQDIRRVIYRLLATNEFREGSDVDVAVITGIRDFDKNI